MVRMEPLARTGSTRLHRLEDTGRLGSARRPRCAAAARRSDASNTPRSQRATCPRLHGGSRRPRRGDREDASRFEFAEDWSSIRRRSNRAPRDSRRSPCPGSRSIRASPAPRSPVAPRHRNPHRRAQPWRLRSVSRRCGARHRSRRHEYHGAEPELPRHPRYRAAMIAVGGGGEHRLGGRIVRREPMMHRE